MGDMLVYNKLPAHLACTDGNLRLVGGSTNRESRVEVCVDGYWGTVCDSTDPISISHNNITVLGAVTGVLAILLLGTVTALVVISLKG